MKTNKNHSLAILFLIVLTIIGILFFSYLIFASFSDDINVADAHSGRTDSNGGHYDKSTGEYHYHHGYPAHKHPGGICPYENKNKIDNDNKTISSSTNQVDKSLSGAQIFLIVFACIIVILIIIKIIVAIKDKREKRY